MGTSDVLLLLRLCLYFTLVGVFALATTAEVNAVFEYQLKIIVVVAHELTCLSPLLIKFQFSDIIVITADMSATSI